MILVITRQQLSILGLEAINTNSEICRHQIFKKVYKRPKIDCKIDIKEMKYFKPSTLMISLLMKVGSLVLTAMIESTNTVYLKIHEYLGILCRFLNINESTHC